MIRESGTGGIASRAMGSAVHMGQLGMDNNNRQFYFPNKQQQHGGHRRHHQWSEGWNGQLPSYGGGQTRRQPYQAATTASPFLSSCIAQMRDRGAI